VFRSVRDVPLVTPRSRRDRSEILRQLGLPGGTPVILIGGRGRLPSASVERAARENRYLMFLTQQQEAAAPNLLCPQIGPELSFSDVIRASDVVVSKLGYSIAAECIAERKRLLFPPRSGFREEAVLVREVPRHIPAQPIAPADYEPGEWSRHLEVLLGEAIPPATLAANGARACAEAILAMIS
jgi:hypothetical protein